MNLFSTSKMDFGGKGNSIVLLKKSFSGFRRMGFSEVGVPKTYWFRLSQIQGELQKRIPVYSHILKTLSLPEKTIDWLEGEPSELEKLTQEIISLEVTAEWELTGRDVINKLGPRVIVRSSMGEEDHENCSFAGCYESVVVQDATPSKLWDAVKRVLVSGFTKQSLM
jgi:hypothetical protein